MTWEGLFLRNGRIYLDSTRCSLRTILIYGAEFRTLSPVHQSQENNNVEATLYTTWAFRNGIDTRNSRRMIRQSNSLLLKKVFGGATSPPPPRFRNPPDVVHVVPLLGGPAVWSACISFPNTLDMAAQTARSIFGRGIV